MGLEETKGEQWLGRAGRAQQSFGGPWKDSSICSFEMGATKDAEQRSELFDSV